jgi:hypothetical protein
MQGGISMIERLEQSRSELTAYDYEHMRVLLIYLLDAYTDNRVTQSKVASTVLRIVRDIDQGQHAQVRDWFEMGRRLID